MSLLRRRPPAPTMRSEPWPTSLRSQRWSLGRRASQAPASTSKEGLYIAVLEASYQRVRATEAALHLENLAPEAALRTLVGFTFDHHQRNQAYIRLVMSENIERGQFISRSRKIQELNVPAIAAIRNLYERGVTEGTFRPGLDPLDIHASISALSFFNVANQHTFGAIFKHDMQNPAHLAARREAVIEMLVRYVRIAV